MRWMIAMGLGFCALGSAASLPGQLSSQDVERLTRLFGMGGVTRLLRSAEAYPTWPGVKLGLEVSLLPAHRADSLGDGQSSLSQFLPMPRVYLAKGFEEVVEIILSFFPSSLNTVSGLGGIVKWAVLKESQDWLAISGIAGWTSVNAFQGEFQASVFEVGGILSKDYVRFRPYAGASILLAQGQVPGTLAVTGNSTQTGTVAGTHFFLGAEWEFPFNLSVQVDLLDWSPGLTLLLGKRF